MTDNQTKLFLSASSKPGNFGATVFTELFKKHKINAVYMPRVAKDAKELVVAIRALAVSGCAISSPLKSEIIPYLDSLDAVAKETNSVNTIVNREGKLQGFNTDLYGVQMALKDVKMKSALVYGSGSVVNSVIGALKNLGFTDISVMARRKEEAEKIAARYRVKSGLNSFELLINATPASLDTANRALFELCPKAKAVFDLVVSPQDTPLILEAKSLNLQTISGIQMSKWQLQKQFELYTGIQSGISEIDSIIGSFYR